MIVLLCLSVPLTACGDEETSAPSCVESLCEEGETRCLGNVLSTCERQDGDDAPPRWRYESCGTSNACSAGTSGLACVSRKCTNLGTGGCIDLDTLFVCDLSGLSLDDQDCGDDLCVGTTESGACVPSTCEDGETRCGGRALTLSCSGGSWTSQECGDDEGCVEEGGEASCVAMVCEAERAWCEDGVAMVCNHDGSVVEEQECAANQVCNSGFCESLMCNGANNIDPGSGQSVPDVVSTDAYECDPGAVECLDEDSIQRCEGGLWVIENCTANEICTNVDGTDTCKGKAAPPLEKTGVITFDLAGTPNTFDLNARADYISSVPVLKISGAHGTRKIELNFSPIELTALGQFKDTDVGRDPETIVTVCYFDGGEVVESPSCPVGFSHSSTVYTAVIDEWNGIGSSVVGTFETTLVDKDNNSLSITNGVFDVKQK